MDGAKEQFSISVFLFRNLCVEILIQKQLSRMCRRTIKNAIKTAIQVPSSYMWSSVEA